MGTALRLFKTGDELYHIVPVDWVSRAIVEIHQRQNELGDTYHLTPPKANTLRELLQGFANYFGYHGVTFVDEHKRKNAKLSAIEKSFYDGLNGVGHRYLSSDPIFDCSNTKSLLPWWTQLHSDASYIALLLNYAELSNFGRGKKRGALMQTPVQFNLNRMQVPL